MADGLPRWPWLLRFPAELESRFHEEGSRSKARLLIGALCIVIVDLFVFVDIRLDPSQLLRSVLFRLVIFTPCGVVALSLLWSNRLRRYDQAIYLAMGVLAGGCSLGAAPVFDSLSCLNTQMMTILVMFAVTTALGLRLRYNLSFIAILLGTDAVYLSQSHWLPMWETYACIAFLFCSAALSVLASCRVEWSRRLSYLLLLREELRAQRLAEQNASLADLSRYDPLTGLSNRRHLEEFARAVWQRESVEARPISLIMMDVDHFKRLNDTYGHLLGDRALVAVADALRESSRHGQDMVARYGGEEFLLLLPGVDRQRAISMAERIAVRVRAIVLTDESSEQTVSITISCGVATLQWSEPRSLEELLAEGDAALYRAKASGRDRVSI